MVCVPSAGNSDKVPGLEARCPDTYTIDSACRAVSERLRRAKPISDEVERGQEPVLPGLIDNFGCQVWTGSGLCKQ
jgi:hypothetical protein